MKKSKNKRVIIVLPAYNAEKTIQKTVGDIPKGLADEIILVDDDSKDRTSDVAKKMGLTVFRHTKNKGYGGNQKTCYDRALEHGADIVIMLHPDYQYDARQLASLIEPIRLGICDVMLGNRIRTRREALASGMPAYKYFSNRMLTLLENIILDLNLPEFHTGLRAYSAKALRTIPYHSNSDDFVFDSEFLAQAVHFGFRIDTVPVPVRYMPEASSINFIRSTIYGLSTLAVLLKFMLRNILRYRIFQRKK